MPSRYLIGLVAILAGLVIASLPTETATAAPSERAQCNGIVDAADYVVWRNTLRANRIMAEWTNGGLAILSCPSDPSLDGPHQIRQHVQGVIEADANTCRMQGRGTTNVLIALLLPAVQKFNGEVGGMGPRAGTACMLNLQFVDKAPGGGSMLMSGQFVFDSAAGTIRAAGPLSISVNFTKIE